MSQYHNSYIDPQQLILNPTPGRRTRTRRSGAGNAHSQAYLDIALLEPGAHHLLERGTHVSPQAILNGQPDSPYVLCYIQERRADYHGIPAMPSISFTVNGEPGPSVLSVLSPGFQLDNAYDHVLDGHGWRRIQYVIDWPGIEPRIERTPAHDKNGAPITRDMAAKEICARLVENLKRYPEVMRDIRWRHVRLIALSFYNSTWAPVWAIDSHMMHPRTS